MHTSGKVGEGPEDTNADDRAKHALHHRNSIRRQPGLQIRDESLVACSACALGESRHHDESACKCLFALGEREHQNHGNDHQHQTQRLDKHLEHVTMNRDHERIAEPAG